MEKIDDVQAGVRDNGEPMTQKKACKMFRVSSCDVYGNMYRDCVQVVVDL